jgi:hypothetical protein
MRKIVGFIYILFFCCWIVSCGSDNLANPDLGAYKMTQICVGEKKFFKMKGRYGTLEELHSEDLVTDDKRNFHYILKDKDFWGFVFDVKITPTGYSAKAVPVGYGTMESKGSASFYVDEKSNYVKAAFSTFNGIEAGPNSPDYQAGYKGQYSCEE